MWTVISIALDLQWQSPHFMGFSGIFLPKTTVYKTLQSAGVRAVQNFGIVIWLK